MPRVGGRVHWLVRVRGGDSARLPRPAILGAAHLPPRPTEDNMKRGPAKREPGVWMSEPRAVARRQPPSGI